MRILWPMLLVVAVACPPVSGAPSLIPAAQASDDRSAALTRAQALELDTPYVPAPGDPLEHHASGFAKIMCSAVFITGLEPEFAAEHVGYLVPGIAPPAAAVQCRASGIRAM